MLQSAFGLATGIAVYAGPFMLQSAFGLATGIAVYAGPRWLPKAEFHRLESR